MTVMSDLLYFIISDKMEMLQFTLKNVDMDTK